MKYKRDKKRIFRQRERTDRLKERETQRDREKEREIMSER